VNPKDKDPVSSLLSIRSEGLITFNSEGSVSYISPLFLELTGAADGELTGLQEAEFSNWLIQRSQLGSPFSGVSLLRARASIENCRRKETIEINKGSAASTLLEVEWFVGTSENVSGVLFVRDVSIDSSGDQAKQKFISTAVHDLRTPLASISGFTELLQTQAFDTSTQQEFLKIMADQADLLTQMMTSVFDLARMDAQHGKDYKFVRSSVQALIAGVIESQKLPCGRISPDVVMPDMTLWVMADHNKLKQAIHQVLDNAYQYSPDGGDVRLEISTVRNLGQPDMACLSVTDHGIGMTPEQTLRIFDRFFRLSTATTTAGSGLGMSLAKKVIERHHGDLRVSSTPQKGTRVDIYLPLASLES
jgi:signal transduction histidine kinase